MLQNSQISVQPLLDEVMSSGKEKNKVMGSVRLEDIEANIKNDTETSANTEFSDLEQDKENIGIGTEITNKPEQMAAFNMLVEKMKSSGTLPEKPQPAVSYIQIDAFRLQLSSRFLNMRNLLKNNLQGKTNMEKLLTVFNWY